jgi:hypothetical protein
VADCPKCSPPSAPASGLSACTTSISCAARPRCGWAPAPIMRTASPTTTARKRGQGTHPSPTRKPAQPGATRRDPARSGAVH